MLCHCMCLHSPPRTHLQSDRLVCRSIARRQRTWWCRVSRDRLSCSNHIGIADVTCAWTQTKYSCKSEGQYGRGMPAHIAVRTHHCLIRCRLLQSSVAFKEKSVKPAHLLFTAAKCNCAKRRAREQKSSGNDRKSELS